MNDIQTPEGFSPFPLDGSFNDVIAPVFITLDGEAPPRIAMPVQKKHLNPIGICHGAVYMALFDIAFSSQVCYAIGKYTGTPTISIDINFLAASSEDEWLYSHVECLKITNTAGFTQGTLRNAEGEVKASANGVFKLPKDIAAAPGVTVEELKTIYSSKK